MLHFPFDFVMHSFVCSSLESHGNAIFMVAPSTLSFSVVEIAKLSLLKTLPFLLAFVLIEKFLINTDAATVVVGTLLIVSSVGEVEGVADPKVMGALLGSKLGTVEVVADGKELGFKEVLVLGALLWLTLVFVGTLLIVGSSVGDEEGVLDPKELGTLLGSKLGSVGVVADGKELGFKEVLVLGALLWLILGSSEGFTDGADVPAKLSQTHTWSGVGPPSLQHPRMLSHPMPGPP